MKPYVICHMLPAWMDVTFAEAAPGMHAAIDAAYHAKYDRYGPQIVGSVVGPEVEAVTIKLVPRS